MKLERFEHWTDVAKYIDHTLLSMDATTRDIEKLCEEAVNESFHAVCINPVFVKTAVKKLRGTNVKVACVISFPLGQTFTDVKLKEAIMCVENGADELDIVSNISLVKEGKYPDFKQELRKIISSVKKVNEKVLIKVIIELCYLSKEEVRNAALCAVDAGADYIKTSTGKGLRGVTIDDVIFLRSFLPEKIGIKAAGGIRSLSQTIELINAGANRIGTSTGIKIINEAKARLHR